MHCQHVCKLLLYRCLILYDILINAKNYLNSNGKMIFVVNKDQGAKSIIKDLEEYYNVEVLNKVKGFYIISLKSR